MSFPMLFYLDKNSPSSHYESVMHQSIGIIRHLFCKPAKNAAMVNHSDGALTLLKGYGADGDINANAQSPRQVLLTRAEDSEEFNVRAGELRENIVVSGVSCSAFQPGALVEIGAIAKIRLTFHCEPCKRIGHLVKSYHDIEGKRGVLGVILNSGPITVGDKVIATPNVFDPFPTVPYERFLRYVSQIPEGKIVTYKQVVIGMGVADSFIRAVPRYIHQTLPDTYPVHRIVDSAGQLLQCLGPRQVEKLTQEQVKLVSQCELMSSEPSMWVDLKQYAWKNVALNLS